MKVFISHAFGGDDEELAGMLKDALGEAGLEGYLAERTQRYDLLIGDKIKQEIDESGWLVAIITERGQASASLHEEIGYALKGTAKVALMIEEGVEKRGVLVYGKEYETFSVSRFGEHSRKVARSISESPLLPPRPRPLGEDAKALLRDRMLLSADSADFARNTRFPRLYCSPLGDDEKPAALFTACPHDLGDHCDVTAPDFREWVSSTDHVEIDGRRVRILGDEQDVDIGTLLVTARRSGAANKNVMLYREFQSSGFFEWGTSYIFFGPNGRGGVEMHLCYLVGSFWAFLASVRLFYEKIGLGAPFSVLLSIRNTNALDLGNYGNEVYDDAGSRRRSLPLPPDPPTHHAHIQLPYPFDSVREMTDERIAAVAKKAARDVCNAYGETAPNCYNEGGSFSWRLWKEIAPRAAWGGNQ